MSSTNQFYPHTLTFWVQSPMYRAFVHVRVHSLTLTFTLTFTLPFWASLTSHRSLASHRSALISHLLPLTTYP